MLQGVSPTLSPKKDRLVITIYDLTAMCHYKQSKS